MGDKLMDPQQYLWEKTRRFKGRTPYGQPVDFATRSWGEPVHSPWTSLHDHGGSMRSELPTACAQVLPISPPPDHTPPDQQRSRLEVPAAQ